MRKLIVSECMSLDGVIQAPGGKDEDRRTYELHAGAFEPMPPGDPFGDLMNAPKKIRAGKTSLRTAVASWSARCSRTVSSMNCETSLPASAITPSQPNRTRSVSCQHRSECG
jgi:hypothetical protein